jgi:maleate cis-trans isomerase
VTAIPTVGILYPGHSAEDDYPRAASVIAPAVRFAVVHTSVGRDTHEIDALIDTGAAWRLRDGAEELRSQGPVSVMWACTSGSFVYGLEGAREQAARIGEQLGVPASSTSLAFADALGAAGLRRVAVGATYPADVAERFRDLLAAVGIEVVQVGAMGIMDASEGGTLTLEELVALARANDRPDAEAVLLPDTAVHTIEHLAALRDRVGKAVLTANQVTVWQALRLAGHPAAGNPLDFLVAV